MIEVWRYDRDNQSSLIEEGRQYIDNKKTDKRKLNIEGKKSNLKPETDPCSPEESAVHM